MGLGPDQALPARRILACLAVLLAASFLWCARPVEAAAPPIRGFVLTGQTAGSYDQARSDRALNRMASDGSSDVAVFTQWFMDTPTSSSIAPDPARTPSDEAILHAIAQARAAGMSVTLKPQIGIRTGNWIGYAHPSDLDAFWADYRSMLLHYADLASQAGATMLVVGTETETLSGDEARWRSLIADVRQHFAGKLTYAANYDEFARVPFWDALDYIGVDAYFGLADDSDPAPSVDALTSAWTQRGILASIAAVSARVGKQVVFTEVGYRAIHGTAVHPNIWNSVDETDTAAQARAYEAFYRATAGQPWMAGLFWWEVNSDEWWVQDYSPLAKPAEQVMVDWNARLAAPQSEVTPPATDALPPPTIDPPTPPATDPPIVDPPTPPTPETPTVDLPTPPATETPAAGSSPPLVRLTLRGRRLRGAILPYQAACGGRVQLNMRLMRHGHWRYVQPPHPLAPGPTGTFTRLVPRGRLRVRAVFESGCGAARSRWIAGLS
jgi:hypothetical protein